LPRHRAKVSGLGLFGKVKTVAQDVGVGLVEDRKVVRVASFQVGCKVACKRQPSVDVTLSHAEQG